MPAAGVEAGILLAELAELAEEEMVALILEQQEHQILAVAVEE